VEIKIYADLKVEVVLDNRCMMCHGNTISCDSILCKWGWIFHFFTGNYKILNPKSITFGRLSRTTVPVSIHSNQGFLLYCANIHPHTVWQSERNIQSTSTY